MRIARRGFMATLVAALGSRGNARAAEAAWAELRDGRALALLRHATAPGVGDPDGFKLGDCATQRNLSATGRAQARAIGDLFRSNDIAQAEVHSSEWCRCLDTAALLGLGDVKPLDLLNSFFGDRADGTAQSAALVAWIRSRNPQRPVLLVTHQVNISALVGTAAGSGEIIFVRAPVNEPLEIIGRIATPA
jgi:broad specificity phosphatase PhoE